VSRWIREVVLDNHPQSHHIDRSSTAKEKDLKLSPHTPTGSPKGSPKGTPKGTTTPAGTTPQQQQPHLERKLLRPWTWLRKVSPPSPSVAAAAAAAARGGASGERGDEVGRARPSDMQDGGAAAAAAAAAVLQQVEDSPHHGQQQEQHDEGGVRDDEEEDGDERKAAAIVNRNHDDMGEEEESGRRFRVLKELRADLMARWPTIEEEAEAAGFPLDDAQLSR